MPPSPFLTAFLLRAAASTSPTTPAVAAPLPSRLLHLHRSVPPSRPSIRPRLASSSRFVYTCCILDLMCCARLPSFSTPSPRCRTARAGCMHQGWGRGKALLMGRQQRCPTHCRKCKPSGSQSPVMGGRLAVVEDLGNDSGMTILCFFLKKIWFSLCNRTPWICYRLPTNGFETANLSALFSLKILFILTSVVSLSKKKTSVTLQTVI